MTSPQWCFDGFRLDLEHVCLWCGAQAVTLPPKTFTVLHYLVTHPDRLVTKGVCSAGPPESHGCVEHYGAGEAYLPVLEAVGQLCRSAGGER
jgi:hypothetical protein